MGHHNRHFAGDRHALSGAWSPPTSSANFCEEDYEVTRYIAEFINTLTNLAYVYYALRYMYGPGSRGLFSPKTDSMSVSLLVLGIASLLYHATLRQNFQFGDEIAMLGLAWSLLHGSLATATAAPGRLAAAGLAVFFPLFAAFYVWTGEIAYHYAAFFVAVSLIVARGAYVFHWRSPALPEARRRAWAGRGWRAFAVLLGAYALWNADLEFCAELRRLRERVGLPWAWGLELHGWWHVMTAASAAWAMDIVREVQGELRDGKGE